LHQYAPWMLGQTGAVQHVTPPRKPFLATATNKVEPPQPAHQRERHQRGGRSNRSSGSSNSLHRRVQ
jgi:hypothetical protein